ncbi:Aste57867_11713 [Aphanomyces stellatus]|uniref:Aste57867_11713 protein n=1 Tax=Aphanomyces stellatus TaxID=120398 RepID=A0A485KTZ6_9STRA|nr:hypothetical protein As57867_011670 [Aphanomyces stellatus]VFT88570.1 Aste57867_11713 [Aphanomyces stellatus]
MSLLQTPHMVSIGMYSFWPTALETTGRAEVEHVSVPLPLYQRLVEQDHRQHRAFGFIRESYRAWRINAMEVKKSKESASAPSSPIKMEEPDSVCMMFDDEDHHTMMIKEEIHAPVVSHDDGSNSDSPRAVDLVDMTDGHDDVLAFAAATDAASAAASDKKRKFRKCGTSNATRILRDWLFDPHNQEHPYPSETEKRRLSQESGLTIKQIGIWFRNARQRLCQPTPTKTTINQEQATSFMNVVGLRVDESTPLRRGAWSPAENAYAQKLIDQFTHGKMPLVEGTPLRSFLAVVLHCHAMRISKKFVRDCSVGKITFRRDRMFQATGAEFDASLRDLLALKALVQDNAVLSTKKTMETEQEAMRVQEWFRTTTDHAAASPPSFEPIPILTHHHHHHVAMHHHHVAAPQPPPAKVESSPLDSHQLFEDLDFDFDGALGWGELDKAVSQIFFP